MEHGERQVAPTRDGIRHDHVARYEWVAARLGNESRRLLDVACGVGYGSQLLAQRGHEVVGVDNDAEALAYAREHYPHERARYKLGDITRLEHALRDTTPFDAAVAFECIEHVSDPLPMLVELRRRANTLYASVPNETVFPHSGPGYTTAFHYRHYTPAEFKSLLEEAGWHVDEWHGQEGPESDVLPCKQGRTVIAVCSLARQKKVPVKAPAIGARHEPMTIRVPDVDVIDDKPSPRSVAICGLGPSVAQYLDLAKRYGTRKKLADETWGINALGDVLICDRLFHMDDVRVQEARARENPHSNIAEMVSWLKTYKGIAYTSMPHPGYPALQAYPLQDVINSLGNMVYFNSTAAYAVALAIHMKVEKILMFGCDFTYADSHDAEKGRGCVEFWLGYAAAKGIKIVTARTSSLLDAYSPVDERTYGYDYVDVGIAEKNGRTTVTFRERAVLPTVKEIEAKYDHSAHPNRLVEEQGASQ